MPLWSGRVEGSEKVAELVGQSGECAAYRWRRQLVEVHRHDAPRALDADLHEKGAYRDPQRRR